MKTKYIFPLLIITIFTLSACNAGPELTPPAEEDAELPTVEEIDEAAEEEEEVEVEEELAEESEPIEEVEEVSVEAVELPEPEYLNYTEAQYTELLGNEPFLLYFHATWCSTCNRVKGEIEADLANFPKGSKILQADFDSELELKEKYGIQVQTTFAVINKNGEHVDTLAVPTTEEIINSFKVIL
jgi:thiol-disulfide isomerase/thioredoxin